MALAVTLALGVPGLGAADEAPLRTGSGESVPESLAERTYGEDGRPTRFVDHGTDTPGPVDQQTPGPSSTDRTAARQRGNRASELSIPAPDTALMRHYMKQYSSPEGLRWLRSVMLRAAPYRAFIEEKIKERGLPPELVYLPVVESSYSNTALSRSGAAGLWQFMTNSIHPFDMSVTDWVDERRDFWKATEGALSKLEDNYRILGDWPMALAAYNVGLGAMRRVVKATGIDDYWILSEQGKLKKETAHYVPKFLAIASVLSKAGAWGIDLGWPENPEWKRVPITRMVDLSLLAEKSGIPLDELKTGNAELRYGITPPTTSYSLKVPASQEMRVADTLQRTDLSLLRYYIHIVKYGDTLSALARHYGVSVDLISRTNGGLDPRRLKIGAKLAIPALQEVGPYVREKANLAALTFDGSYKVKKGDTLWSIALTFDVDPEALAVANGMELSALIHEGQVLKTPILELGSLR